MFLYFVSTISFLIQNLMKPGVFKLIKYLILYMIYILQQKMRCTCQQHDLIIILFFQNMTKYILLIILILISLFLVSSKKIEVPKIDSNLEHDIKLGNLQYVSLPKFEFDSIYEKSVQILTNETSKDFPPCTETAPQISFYITDQVSFVGAPEQPPLIYKFQTLKYSQFLLDIYYDQSSSHEDQVYLMFQNQIFVYIMLQNLRSITRAQVYRVQGISANQTKLSIGYFTKISSQIIFINEQYAIKVSSLGAEVVEGLQFEKGFMTAISIQNEYIGVAYKEAGIKIYQYTDSKLAKVLEIKASQINSDRPVYITDMIYYDQKNELMVLDEDSGLYGLTLRIESDGIYGDNFNLILNKGLCKIMQINQQTKVLYAVCDKVYEIYLQNYPKINQRQLPHPKIKVHEIYTIGPLVAFIGRSVFKIMYLDRMVNYYQDQNVDKLLFTKSTFISANQYGLILGTYKIDPPTISCYTDDQKYLGVHNLAFITKAECNSQFFQDNNISNQDVGNYTQNDTCIYTVYEKVYFWKPAQIYLLPILISFLIFSLIVLTVAMIWLLKKLRLKRISHQLDEYMKISGTNAELSSRKSDKQDYQKYEDEVEVSDEKKRKNQSNASNLDEQDMENKPNQIELGNTDNFDIQ